MGIKLLLPILVDKTCYLSNVSINSLVLLCYFI